MNIIEAIEDKSLFGQVFGDLESWKSWFVCLKTIFALPLQDAQELEIFKACTGRERPPSQPVKEAYLICGRGAGKSRIASLVATYLSCFKTYQLAPGEKGVSMILSADKRQSKVVFGYTQGIFDSVSILKSLVDRETVDEIDLQNNVSMEIHAASFRGLRGYSVLCAVCDEIAFWRSEESANPDLEILNALRPALGRVPGSLLLCISSPYARRGVLWTAYKKYYAQDNDRILVWQAGSLKMNPCLDSEVIRQAYEEDEAMASAEYGALFRRDIETFIDREALEACVDPDRRESPYAAGFSYSAFCDPSGGSSDSMTLAIAHKDKDGRVVLDAIRERKPPFSPEDVVKEFSETLKTYRITKVSSDYYGGEWVRERFREHGITCEVANKAKSEIYLAFLPILNSKKVDLLDHPMLITQTCNLERRTGRSGRDSIDHAPMSHDDIVNAVAGVCVLVQSQTKVTPGAVSLGIMFGDRSAVDYADDKPEKKKLELPEEYKWIGKYSR